MKTTALGLLTALLVLVFSFASSPLTQAEDTKSLFERLGGKPAIAAVVDGMVANIAADEKLAWRFEKTDFDAYKPTFVSFVCMVTGGPCDYQGLSMPNAHSRMGVSSEEFDMTVGHVLAVLDDLGVPAREKGGTDHAGWHVTHLGYRAVITRARNLRRSHLLRSGSIQMQGATVIGSHEAQLLVQSLGITGGEHPSRDCRQSRMRHEVVHQPFGQSPPAILFDDKQVVNIGAELTIRYRPGEGDLPTTIK